MNDDFTLNLTDRELLEECVRMLRSIKAFQDEFEPIVRSTMSNRLVRRATGAAKLKTYQEFRDGN